MSNDGDVLESMKFVNYDMKLYKEPELQAANILESVPRPFRMSTEAPVYLSHLPLIKPAFS